MACGGSEITYKDIEKIIGTGVVIFLTFVMLSSILKLYRQYHTIDIVFMINISIKQGQSSSKKKRN